MNGFLKWLGKKLFGPKPGAEGSLYRTSRRVSPGNPVRPTVDAANVKPVTQSRRAATRNDLLNARAKLFDGDPPGNDAPIRNRMIREDTGTHDTLKIFDESVLESDEPDAFDPYNTGQFDRSSYWNNRTRK